MTATEWTEIHGPDDGFTAKHTHCPRCGLPCGIVSEVNNRLVACAAFGSTSRGLQLVGCKLYGHVKVRSATEGTNSYAVEWEMGEEK